MFKCQQCGACCSQLGLFTEPYKILDRGDGICRHFNTAKRNCSIYAKRPEMCNTEDSFKYFADGITREEYSALLQAGCKHLRKVLFFKTLAMQAVTTNRSHQLMFLQNLNADQQAAFLSLADELVHADNVYDDAEKAKMEAFRAQLPGISAKKYSYPELSRLFTGKAARASAMLELIGVAVVDGSIAPEEQTLLNEVGAAFAISEGELADMTSWVSRIFYLFREAQAFMEE